MNNKFYIHTYAYFTNSQTASHNWFHFAHAYYYYYQFAIGHRRLMTVTQYIYNITNLQDVYNACIKHLRFALARQSNHKPQLINKIYYKVALL